MIKLTKRTHRRALTEFKKGKTFWYAEYKNNMTQKDKLEHDAIICVKWMKPYQKEEAMMAYKEYDINGKLLSRLYETEWEGWNFITYNFYVLNKNETAPYLKKIMAEQITNGKQEYE